MTEELNLSSFIRTILMKILLWDISRVERDFS